MTTRKLLATGTAALVVVLASTADALAFGKRGGGGCCGGGAYAPSYYGGCYGSSAYSGYGYSGYGYGCYGSSYGSYYGGAGYGCYGSGGYGYGCYGSGYRGVSYAAPWAVAPAAGGFSGPAVIQSAPVTPGVVVPAAGTVVPQAGVVTTGGFSSTVPAVGSSEALVVSPAAGTAYYAAPAAIVEPYVGRRGGLFRR